MWYTESSSDATSKPQCARLRCWANKRQNRQPLLIAYNQKSFTINEIQKQGSRFVGERSHPRRSSSKPNTSPFSTASVNPLTAHLERARAAARAARRAPRLDASRRRLLRGAQHARLSSLFCWCNDAQTLSSDEHGEAAASDSGPDEDCSTGSHSHRTSRRAGALRLAASPTRARRPRKSCSRRRWSARARARPVFKICSVRLSREIQANAERHQRTPRREHE